MNNILRCHVTRIILVVLSVIAVGCSDYSKEVPGLIRQLQSADASKRNAAALRLGRIGSPAADKAVEPLIRLLSDPNAGVQSAAAYALRTIGTKRAQEALERARKKR